MISISHALNNHKSTPKIICSRHSWSKRCSRVLYKIINFKLPKMTWLRISRNRMGFCRRSSRFRWIDGVPRVRGANAASPGKVRGEGYRRWAANLAPVLIQTKWWCRWRLKTWKNRTTYWITWLVDHQISAIRKVISRRRPRASQGGREKGNQRERAPSMQCCSSSWCRQKARQNWRIKRSWRTSQSSKWCKVMQKR